MVDERESKEEQEEGEDLEEESEEEAGEDEEIFSKNSEFSMDDFSRFVPSSSLPSLDMGIEQGIQGVENMPSSQPRNRIEETEEEEQTEEQKYLQRKYKDMGTSETPLVRDLRESRVMVDFSELQNRGMDMTPRRMEIGRWHELQDAEGDIMEDYISRLEDEEKDKLPFEQQDKKYKGKKIA